MGGSAAEAPTSPDAAQPADGVRASDAERDEVVARLREEFAAGRLSQDTFMYRVNAVLQTRHQAELPPFLADLPATPGPPGPPGPPGAAPAAAGPAGRQPSLITRLRAAWPRRARSGFTLSGSARPPAAAPLHRLTEGMPRAGESRHAALLQFPRGTGTFFSIGRDAGCDLTIGDMTVSRMHARLERTAEGWLLTDLASTNGTRVNGWRVRGPVTVRAGDLVRFGDAEYALAAPDGN